MDQCFPTFIPTKLRIFCSQPTETLFHKMGPEKDFRNQHQNFHQSFLLMSNLFSLKWEILDCLVIYPWSDRPHGGGGTSGRHNALTVANARRLFLNCAVQVVTSKRCHNAFHALA